MISDSDNSLALWLDDEKTSLDDLYEALGETSPRSNAFGGNLVKQGRATLLGLRAQLHDAVFGNEKIQQHPAIGGSDNVNDSIALAAIIAAVIPPVIAVSMNGLLISALIVRIGVRKFCGAPPSEPDAP